MTRAVPPDTIDQQRRASDPDASAWVSANAGSGKTHVLAQRVVRLLLRGVPPARILCLTFTKAAAANMSMRVFGILAKWTRASDDELTRAIEAVGEPTPSAEALVFARRLFARTVETPGGLKIQTIHAFCEKLLHLFPFEANVAARFEVIEDARKAELLAEARRRTLERAIHDETGALGAALRLLAAETSATTFGELIQEALHKQELVAAAQNADAARAAAYLRALGAQLGVAPDETLAEIDRRIVEDGVPRDHWFDMAVAIELGGANDRKFALKWREAHAAPDDARARVYAALFLDSKGQPKGLGAQKIVSSAVHKADPALLARLEAERDRVCALLEKRKAVHTLARTGALLAVVLDIMRNYRREKEAQGLLDFADLIAAANRLLARTDAAWVLHKLDRGVDHILVDEAQDTSPEQWDILERIALEFTAGEGQRGTPRTFFAVGDEKQSIFSFQGAAPQKFDEMRRAFQRRAEGARQRFEYIELKRSFRSSKGVLETVDAIFSREENYGGLSADRARTVHEAWKEDLPGLIELWELAAPAQDPEPRDWKLPLDVLDRNDPPVVVAQRIAREIAAWLAPDARDNVEDRDGGRRRIRPGDILILVRSRGPFFEAVIRALKQERVPVAGADRLKLTQHIAVMDLVAAGRAALLPDDDLTLATVLKSPLVGLTDDDLIALAPRRKGSLWEALGASDDLMHRAAFERIERWRAAARRLTPFFFYARLLGAEQGRRDMLARLGPEAGDAMDEFLRLALDHDTRDGPSLVGFLADLQAADLEVKRDMEAGGDAVRVMTVHASKGLESKIVFLADTCGSPIGPKEPKLFDLDAGPHGRLAVWSPGAKNEPEILGEARALARRKAEEEYRRLLYVAATRAEERLYVAGFRGKQEPRDGCWYKMMESVLRERLRPARARWSADETVWRAVVGDMPSMAPQGEVARLPDEEPPPRWLLTPAAVESAPGRPLTPSSALAAADRLEPEPRESSGGAPEAARAGLLVHALLQHLPDVPADARPAAARRFLAVRAAGLDPQALADQALAVLADPALAPLFGPGSRAEVGLGGRVDLPDGRRVEIAGQIDRLAVAGDEVWIADYKTGRPRPAAEVPRAYLAQLALYRAAVAPLYPDKRLRVVLIWTEGPLAVECSPAALDAALLDVGRTHS